AGLALTWLRAFGEFGATVLVAYHPYSFPVLTYVNFSGTGLLNTTWPTLSALLVAIVVLYILNLLSRSKSKNSLFVIEDIGPDPLVQYEGIKPCKLELKADMVNDGFHLVAEMTSNSGRLSILGRSGAGKTTLIKVLTGIAGGKNQTVKIDDKEVGFEPPGERSIGYVPQGGALIPHAKVYDQFLLNFGQRRALKKGQFNSEEIRRLKFWITRLGISNHLGKLPHELSGGERQRVAIARALSKDVKVLVLDEPFNGLDRVTKLDLLIEMVEISRLCGIGLVLVTHDPSEAAIMGGDVGVMDSGNLVQVGSFQELMDNPTDPVVAKLLWYSPINDGVIEDETSLSTQKGHFKVNAKGLSVGQKVKWSVKPERVVVIDHEKRSLLTGDSSNWYSGNLVAEFNFLEGSRAKVILSDGSEVHATIVPSVQDIYERNGRTILSPIPVAVEINPSNVRLWAECSTT
ncbi:MAG: ATP-binding cassette domain-containing protein, partial [Acidimicrobiales bacterium]|nr:ATP-binding cassette domain-containing protein [Acidimicrobiales bacterium]